jgi:hypothetical protein
MDIGIRKLFGRLFALFDLGIDGRKMFLDPFAELTVLCRVHRSVKTGIPGKTGWLSERSASAAEHPFHFCCPRIILR